MRCRAIVPDGAIERESYEYTDYGVECDRDDGEFVAVVPYSSLVAFLDEEQLARRPLRRPSGRSVDDEERPPGPAFEVDDVGPDGVSRVRCDRRGAHVRDVHRHP
ncbi:hypothetical protein [Halomarina oriensis]|uniref:Uncharacterized protein n=1 Tax=Halomarina oriensis TaxID=671145 RepID=A0A6B0GEQ5_9EURY|nr:hypothetical protein [Halomarina oriensis]MWG33020.1 hypothetical protein [Halomarina oriensis]